MTLQTILYFSSILLTCALTGFLAWYAWQRRSLPGVRAYAGLALAECLLAVCEMFSMLSPNQEIALSWFQARFLFTASIPVLFLVFALGYSERREWLSKRLLVGLFTIPVITQVMLWSNGLHGLWLVHEVAFHRNGPLWIVETGARVPGVWFLAHSFYSLLLMLAGIVVLLVAAWGRRKTYLGRALLLSAGALTGVIVSIIPIFNLNPQAWFNPFTPGIGLSAVLYALAIFRFQFLKGAPVGEASKSLTGLDAQEKCSLALLGLIFLALVAGIMAAGYFSYKNFERQHRAQAEKGLLAIVELKVDGLVNWRAERIGDAETLRQNPAFADLAQDFLADPADLQARERMQAWLDSLRNAYHYERIFLLDTGGRTRISSPGEPEPVAAHLRADAAAVLESGQVAFLDFHRNTPGDVIYLSLLAPIYEENSQQPLGVLVLRIAPDTYLYPYLQQWPAPSQSAETLLVRREGNEVLYLNPLRFQPDAALNLRTPLADTDVLAVKAVLGEAGVAEGRDYRNQPVIGALHPVPGTPWFLVARMDAAEVYEPLRERLWQTIIFFGALILASGAGLGLTWRQQRVRYYREQAGIAESLRASEERFRLAFETSPDSVAITRARDGLFVSVNKGFEQITGYTREEVIGKTSLEVNIWKDPEDRRKIVAGLQAGGEVRDYEAPFLTRDGEIVGLMSAVIIQLDGEPHILNITRDITARVQAEELLQKSEARYQALFNNMTEGFYQAELIEDELGRGVDFRFIDVNPSHSRIIGMARESVIGKKASELFPGLEQTWFEAITEVVHTGNPITVEGYVEATGRYYSNSYFSPAPGQFASIFLDTTERKQAEADLKESERRFRDMMEQVQLVSAMLDVRANITFANDFLLQLTGWKREEIIGRNWFDVFIPEQAAVRQDLFRDLSAGVVPVHYENEILTRAGERRLIAWNNTVLHDSNGAITGIAGVGVDITERKWAEEQLRRSEASLKQAQRVAHVGSWTWYIQENRLDWSDEMYHIFGIEKEKFSGLLSDVMGQAIHPDDRAEVERSNRSVMEDRKPIPLEYRVVWPNGVIRTVWAEAGKLIMDESGKPLILTGIVQDITERKQAEQAVQEAEARYRALVEQVPAIIYRDSAEQTGQTLYISPQIETILGYIPEEWMADNDFWIEVMHPDDRERVSTAYKHANETGQPFSAEYRLVRPDGREAWMRDEAALVYGPSGSPLFWQGILLDITERKRAEAQLALYTERLEELVDERTRELREAHEQLVRQERLATLGQLAGSIGHELRNPLGVIANAVYFLKLSQPGAGDKVREYLDIIDNETRASDKIVTDLLDYTRVKSLDQAPVSVSAAAQATLERYPAPPPVEVTLDLPPDLPPALADPRHVEQILGNLVVNACQAMTDGGKLTIAAGTEGDMIFISVKDTGIGIPPENLDKIFEPLFTTKSRGIGLGLAVSQKLAQANGGRIAVQSASSPQGEAGAGSVFTLYLPVYKETK